MSLLSTHHLNVISAAVMAPLQLDCTFRGNDHLYQQQPLGVLELTFSIKRD